MLNIVDESCILTIDENLNKIEFSCYGGDGVDKDGEKSGRGAVVDIVVGCKKGDTFHIFIDDVGGQGGMEAGNGGGKTWILKEEYGYFHLIVCSGGGGGSGLESLGGNAGEFINGKGSRGYGMYSGEGGGNGMGGNLYGMNMISKSNHINDFDGKGGDALSSTNGGGGGSGYGGGGAGGNVGGNSGGGGGGGSFVLNHGTIRTRNDNYRNKGFVIINK